VAGRFVAGKLKKAPTVLRGLDASCLDASCLDASCRDASCRDARPAAGRFILGSF
jgi:hypothetical protein